MARIIIIACTILTRHCIPAVAFGADIIVGSVTGRVGDNVALEVHIRSSTEEDVAYAQNDIPLTGTLDFVVSDTGTPGCSVNPSVSNPPFFGRSFLPSGCVANDDCNRVRALVMSLTGAFQPGTILLYQCDVKIARAPECGTEVLGCENATVLSSVGDSIPVTCVEGWVTVPPPGDCNEDGHTTIDEAILAVAILLEQRPVADCAAADVDDDGTVTVDEVTQAVRAVLECG